MSTQNSTQVINNVIAQLQSLKDVDAEALDRLHQQVTTTRLQFQEKLEREREKKAKQEETAFLQSPEWLQFLQDYYDLRDSFGALCNDERPRRVRLELPLRLVVTGELVMDSNISCLGDWLCDCGDEDEPYFLQNLEGRFVGQMPKVTRDILNKKLHEFLDGACNVAFALFPDVKKEMDNLMADAKDLKERWESLPIALCGEDIDNAAVENAEGR